MARPDVRYVSRSYNSRWHESRENWAVSGRVSPTSTWECRLDRTGWQLHACMMASPADHACNAMQTKTMHVRTDTVRIIKCSCSCSCSRLCSLDMHLQCDDEQKRRVPVPYLPYTSPLVRSAPLSAHLSSSISKHARQHNGHRHCQPLLNSPARSHANPAECNGADPVTACI